MADDKKLTPMEQLLLERSLMTRPTETGATLKLPNVPFAQESPLTRFTGEFLESMSGAPTGGEGGGVAGLAGASLGMLSPGALLKFLKGLAKPASTVAPAVRAVETATPKALSPAALRHEIPGSVVEEVMAKAPVAPASTGRQALPPAGLDPTPEQLRAMGEGMVKMLNPADPFERRLAAALQNVNKSHPHVVGKLGTEINFDPRFRTARGEFESAGAKQLPVIAKDLSAGKIDPASLDPDAANLFRRGTVHVNRHNFNTGADATDVGDLTSTLAHELSHSAQTGRKGAAFRKEYAEELRDKGYNQNRFEVEARRAGERAKARAEGRPVPRPTGKSDDQKLFEMMEKLAAELGIKK